jgi:hypothetical protein
VNCVNAAGIQSAKDRRRQAQAHSSEVRPPSERDILTARSGEWKVVEGCYLSQK